jgi:hypothetical protein
MAPERLLGDGHDFGQELNRRQDNNQGRHRSLPAIKTGYDASRAVVVIFARNAFHIRVKGGVDEMK